MIRLAILAALLLGCQTQVVELRPADAAVADAPAPDAAAACGCYQPCDRLNLCRTSACTVDGVCAEAAPQSCTAATGCAGQLSCRRVDAPTALCP